MILTMSHLTRGLNALSHFAVETVEQSSAFSDDNLETSRESHGIRGS